MALKISRFRLKKQPTRGVLNAARAFQLNHAKPVTLQGAIWEPTAVAKDGVVKPGILRPGSVRVALEAFGRSTFPLGFAGEEEAI